MTKEKEAMEVQLGESGEEVKLAIVEEASPANAAAQQAISELARAKTPLEQLVERVRKPEYQKSLKSLLDRPPGTARKDTVYLLLYTVPLQLRRTD